MLILRTALSENVQQGPTEDNENVCKNAWWGCQIPKTCVPFPETQVSFISDMFPVFTGFCTKGMIIY